MMVMTNSATLFSVFFVDSFILVEFKGFKGFKEFKEFKIQDSGFRIQEFKGFKGRASAFIRPPALRLVIPFGLVTPVGRCEAFVLGLEGSGLGLPGGCLLELRIASQVLEALSGLVVDIHVLDVVRGELVP